MPLEQGHSRETISANIGELIKAGHKPNQAAAIAYKTAGLAKDMSDEDWDELLGGLGKFFAEEREEPEHANDIFSEGDHPRDDRGKFTGPLSESGDVREVAESLANRLRNEFPASHIDTNHWGSAAGKSSYVTMHEKESSESQKSRHAKWTAAKGTKRGPEPGQKVVNWESRVSDHAVGPLRASQLAAMLGPKSTHEDVNALIERMRDAAPWLSKSNEIVTHAADGWRIALASDEAPLGPFLSRDLALRAAALVSGDVPAGLACDKSSSRVFDKDGRLHLEKTHITKACCSPYLGNEIPGYQKLNLDPERIYVLLRDPEELKKAASTFNGVPLMRQHVPTSAEDHRANDVVGSTGSSAEFNYPYLDNALAIWPQHAIDGIEDESKRELSSSYHYKPDMTPGTYEGTPYDGVMRDIVGNHVALVEKGRAGPDVLVGDEALNQEKDMSKPAVVLSRTAVRTQGALCAYLVPKLASDAMPKFSAALALGLKDINRKNLKDKSKDIVKLAKDAAEPMLTPEAKKAGGVGPDDVIMKLLEMSEGLGSAEPAEMDEQPGLETAASGGLPEWKTKVMDALKAKGMDEVSCKEVMDMMPEDMPEDEETPEAKAEREAKEKKAKDEKEKPMAGEPATRTAMDAAIKLAEERTRKATLATLNGIREAERKVRPLIGDITVAMDSADDIYALALKQGGIKIDGVHPSAFPAMVDMLVASKGEKKAPIIANDAAFLDDRAAFDKSLGIEPRRVRVLA